MDKEEIELWMEAATFACRRTRVIPVGKAGKLAEIIMADSGLPTRDLVRRVAVEFSPSRAISDERLARLVETTLHQFYRLRNLMNADRLSKAYIRLTVGFPVCNEGQILQGTIWERREHPIFPLVACKIGVCSCGYMVVPAGSLEHFYPNEPIRKSTDC